MNMDQFYETLHLKLAGADSNLSALKAKIGAQTEHAEREVRTHLDEVTKRIAQGEAKAAAARADVEKWVKHEGAAAREAVAELKAKGDAAKLHARADLAEHYAVSAIDVAVAAVDAAEKAALEAWLARRDADHPRGK